MGFRSFKFLVPVVIATVLLQTLVPAFGAGSTYNPGVVAGQWARYGRISANWYSSNDPVCPHIPSPISSLESVNSTTVSVQNVQGPYITVGRARSYANRTSFNDTLWGDVQTGEGNLTGWIVAGNLTAGDETYQSSGQTFNSTISRIYLGLTRNVNVLNINQSYTILCGTATLKVSEYWDQVSGVLLERHYAFDVVSGTGQLEYGHADAVVVDSNIFGILSHGSDFSIAGDPSHTGFVAGTSASSTIKLTSIRSFSGNVTLLIQTAFCSGFSCPHADLTSYNVNLVANGTAMSTLTFEATVSTAYDVSVNATSGGLTHSVKVDFTVSAPPPSPDFSLTASASLSIQAGKSDIAILEISPGAGFTSQVNLSVTAPNGVAATLARDSITGSGTIDLTVAVANDLAPGTYMVAVKGMGGSQTHTKTITVTVTAPLKSPSAVSNLILGLDPTLFYGIIAAVVLLTIAGGIAAIRLRQTIEPTQGSSLETATVYAKTSKKNSPMVGFDK